MSEPAQKSELGQSLPANPTPQEVLAHAIDLFPDMVISSSLGPQTLVLIDMLYRMGATVPVFLLDTGLLFPQTLDLKEQVEERYGITIEVVRPEMSVEEQEERFGELYKTDPDGCCRIRKVVPLAATLRGRDAWITGLRGDMSRTREGVQPIDWDAPHGLYKVNPLAGWSRDQVMEYIRVHNVPLNPLLAEGFKSIGCWPCTRPVGADEDERAGRWPGRAKTECGIHTPFTLSK